MKVTSILPDDLILEVRQLTNGRNITDSLLIALQQWVALQKIKALNQEVVEHPLEFEPGFTAEEVRSLNRR
jgi:hypothetical protein